MAEAQNLRTVQFREFTITAICPADGWWAVYINLPEASGKKEADALKETVTAADLPRHVWQLHRVVCWVARTDAVGAYGGTSIEGESMSSEMSNCEDPIDFWGYVHERDIDELDLRGFCVKGTR